MAGKAAVLLREKMTDEQGNLREMVMWQVEQLIADFLADVERVTGAGE